MIATVKKLVCFLLFFSVGGILTKQCEPLSFLNFLETLLPVIQIFVIESFSFILYEKLLFLQYFV